MFGRLRPPFQILGQAALRRPRRMLRPWSACRQDGRAVCAARASRQAAAAVFDAPARVPCDTASDGDQRPPLVEPMPSGQGGTVMPRARLLLVAGLAVAAYLGLPAEMALPAGGDAGACAAPAAREPRRAADPGSSPSLPTGLQGRTERPIERPAAVDEMDEGRDRLAPAASLNELATLYWTTGHHGAAELLLKRAIAVDETTHGCDHPKLAVLLDSLAGLYQATGRQRRGRAAPRARRRDRHEGARPRSPGPRQPAQQPGGPLLGNRPARRGRAALRAGPRNSREKVAARALGPCGHPRELRRSPRAAWPQARTSPGGGLRTRRPGSGARCRCRVGAIERPPSMTRRRG